MKKIIFILIAITIFIIACSDGNQSTSPNTPSGTSAGTPSGNSISTPIPTGYPIPQGSNKCRTTFHFAYSTFSIDKDFSTSTKEWYVNYQSIKYGMFFYNPSDSNNHVCIIIPTLSIGTYSATTASGMANPMTNLSYKWSETIGSDYSWENSYTSQIKIEGIKDGYIWGSYSGTLGDVTPYTYLSNGKFACIP